MSAEYKLQKEFTQENIKLKISGKSVVRAWRNRGFQRHFRKGKDEGSKFRKVKSHLAKFRKVDLHGAKWPNFAP